MLLLIGAFLLLMIVGAPVAISMAVASLLYIVLETSTPDIIAAQRMIAGVESFPLLAVPFFIMAGNLMNIAGVTGRIYHFALSLVGWMKGGLAQVNIIGSVVFSGMSGTALADAAGIGTIEIKAMKDHGYPVEAAVGVTAASATVGPIFPPSLPFVIYGMMANVSIGALFLAGILPGIVMTVLMMLTVFVFAHRKGWGSDTPFELKRLMGASLEVVVVLCFPVAVYLLVMAGLSLNVAVILGLAALVALDWYFDFSAVMALMTPVLLIGGMTMGVGMALHEKGELDPRFGHVVNHDLAEYHVPVNADITDIEADWLDEKDPQAGPLGARGVGEIGIVGAAAAIANAAFNATGVRVRDLPIFGDAFLPS